jgi:mono/diheme cytochrome c family protein
MLFRSESFQSVSGLASKSIASRALASLLALSTVTTAACGDGTVADPGTEAADTNVELAAVGKLVTLDQGWDAATRSAFYQTSEGSRMLPYTWFLHLEQADNFFALRTPANMRRMGYLVDDPSPSNPDGLPVGFARDVDPVRGDALGLTCAGCHTGEIAFAGKRVRIDGGQSFGDVEQLQNAILGSLEATLSSTTKFNRFAAKVIGAKATVAQKDELRAKMETVRSWWDARIERSRGQTPHGPTRTDAFTIIGNEVVCDLFQDPRNCTPDGAVAPTNFPPLWNTSDLEWVQYNSSVHSPIGRNVGQVTGTFAEAKLDTTSPLAQAGLIVDSTARIDNLHSLESSVKKLKSPVWPESVFGKINVTLANKGDVIYEANCAGCHDPNPARTGPNAFGKTFARVDFSTPLFPAPDGTVPPQGLLGTDSTAAISFATRRAFPGPFTAIATAKGLLGPDGKASVAALLSVSGTLILQRFFAINGKTDAQKIDYLDYRESLTPTTAQLTTYKARPLNGVAFTAPYLHNGSVASLHELLLPPAQRLKQFYVGSNVFDPIKVGFLTIKTPEGVLLDTTKTGNGNGGHVYGTNLSLADRLALIEYLKTL